MWLVHPFQTGYSAAAVFPLTFTSFTNLPSPSPPPSPSAFLSPAKHGGSSSRRAGLPLILRRHHLHLLLLLPLPTVDRRKHLRSVLVRRWRLSRSHSGPLSLPSENQAGWSPLRLQPRLWSLLWRPRPDHLHPPRRRQLRGHRYRLPI